ncbi:SCP2 sterol-binding domain-containing protein 1 isoform X7 [Callithrix jacchus]
MTHRARPAAVIIMGRTYLAGPENRRARYVSQKSCLASLSPGEMPAPASPSAMLKGSLRPHQQLSICQCHPCTACRTISRDQGRERLHLLVDTEEIAPGKAGIGDAL